ncbi:hypothetical protein CLOM_g2763, partial [Closterium sp. NIES-68]
LSRYFIVATQERFLVSPGESACFALVPPAAMNASALLVPTALFIALSPGFLLQIPGDKGPVDVAPNRVPASSVVVHAAVFAAANYGLQTMKKMPK